MILVPSVPRDPLVLLVTPERMARMVSQALWELVEIVVLRVSVVSLDLLGPRASRVRRVRKAEQALVVSRVSKDPRVTLATVALKARVVVVQLGLRGHRESKVPRVNAESPVLVLVAPLAPWAPRASVVRWVSKVRRVTLVHQDLKALVVAMVSRATKELQAQWDAPACVVPRVTVVCRDQRVTLASRAPRVTRETSAFVGLLAQLGSLDLPVHRVLLDSVAPSGLWGAVV